MNLEIKKIDEEGFEDFFSILSMMSEWESRGSLSEDVKEGLRKDYFCEHPKYEVLLAWVDKKVSGFIIFFQTYATFDAKERGYSRIELLAFGDGPRKFYEKFGFKCEEQNHHYRKYLN